MNKQELLDKFVIYLRENYTLIFQYRSLREMILEKDLTDIEIEFFNFIRLQKPSLEVYETINKNKFIELALCFIIEHN
jgi:hypothetical protein